MSSRKQRREQRDDIAGAQRLLAQLDLAGYPAPAWGPPQQSVHTEPALQPSPSQLSPAPAPAPAPGDLALHSGPALQWDEGAPAPAAVTPNGQWPPPVRPGPPLAPEPVSGPSSDERDSGTSPSVAPPPSAAPAPAPASVPWEASSPATVEGATATPVPRPASPLHGARPVTVQAMAGFHQVATESALATAVLPVLASPPVPATPQAPGEVAEFIRQRATQLPRAVPVVLTGVDGSAGRTTLARELARQASELLGESGGVCVDGVSVWGRLTRETERWGTVTVANAHASGWTPQRGGDNGLSHSLGAATIPAQQALETHATTADVLEVVRRLGPVSSLIAVDGPADPAGGVAAALSLQPEAVIVVVSPGTDAGVWAARQVVQHYERSAAVPHHRLVVALRGLSRRWPDTARASAQQLIGGGIEVVEIPYIAGFTESRRPAAYTAATARLLAAVLARGTATPATAPATGSPAAEQPPSPTYYA